MGRCPRGQKQSEKQCSRLLQGGAEFQRQQVLTKATGSWSKEFLRSNKVITNTISLQAPKELVQSMPVGILRITQGSATITDELNTHHKNSASNPVD